MKTKVAGIACFLVVGGWAYIHGQAAAPAGPALGQNGRYQVVAAEIDTSSFGGKLNHKTAFRVDTQTGRTWELIEVEGKSGGRNLYWTELSDLK